MILKSGTFRCRIQARRLFFVGLETNKFHTLGGKGPPTLIPFGFPGSGIDDHKRLVLAQQAEQARNQDQSLALAVINYPRVL